jgi:hypothetical protein
MPGLGPRLPHGFPTGRMGPTKSRAPVGPREARDRRSCGGPSVLRPIGRAARAPRPAVMTCCDLRGRGTGAPRSSNGPSHRGGRRRREAGRGGRPAGERCRRADRILEDWGLIPASYEEGLPPLVRRAGRQYLALRGSLDPCVLRFLPREIDDLYARRVLVDAGTINRRRVSYGHTPRRKRRARPAVSCPPPSDQPSLSE